jgi:hypothetical protein
MYIIDMDCRYGSLCNVLQQLLPEHNWNPLLFERVRRHSLDTVSISSDIIILVYGLPDNRQRELLDEVSKQLGIQHFEEWYNVKYDGILMNLNQMVTI